MTDEKERATEYEKIEEIIIQALRNRKIIF